MGGGGVKFENLRDDVMQRTVALLKYFDNNLTKHQEIFVALEHIHKEEKIACFWYTNELLCTSCFLRSVFDI